MVWGWVLQERSPVLRAAMVLPGGWGVPAGTAPRMLRDAKVPANINPKNTYGSPFFPMKQDAVGLDTVSGEQS